MTALPDSGELPEVSILIPTFNDGAKLRRCLLALEAQQPLSAGAMEAVVVVDGSTDDTLQILDALVAEKHLGKLSLKVESLPENRGRSAARNRAFELSRAPWIVYMDADLEPVKDWLWNLRKNQLDQSLVSIGAMLYRMRDNAGEELPLKKYQRYLQSRGPGKSAAGDRIRARHFYTCNSALHRSLLERAGPFDERMTVWGGEDIDMGIRLGQAGATMIYVPQALAWHGQERSFRAHCRNLKIFGEQVLPLLLHKHPQLASDLNLERIDSTRIQGRLFRFLSRCGLKELLLTWEEISDGFFMPEALYTLCVYLHYAGGWRQSKRTRNESD